MPTTRLAPRSVCGTHGEGVLRSGDGGRTWEPAGLAALSVRSWRCRAHVYAGTRPARLFRSTSGGSWEELRGFRRMSGRFLWFAPSGAWICRSASSHPAD